MSAPSDGSSLGRASSEIELTWDEAILQAKILGEPIIRAARAARARGEEDNLCNELLEVLRNGPGTDPSSKAYRTLTSPLYAKGVEYQQQWTFEPPTSLPDEDYQIDFADPDDNWRTKKIGTRKFCSQWDKYDKSPEAWPYWAPDDPNGFKLAPEPNDNFQYEPDWFPEEVSNPSKYEQHEFGCNWHFTPTINWNQPYWMEWFWNWLNKVPIFSLAVDIYHEPFFDGTAVPDGGFGLFMQDIEHLPTPRDLKDEETRIHWHETASGLVHDALRLIEPSMSEKGRAEKDLAELQSTIKMFNSLRLTSTSGTTNGDSSKYHIPIASRVPSIYLRPVSYDDYPDILSIMSHYASQTWFGSVGQNVDWPPWTGEGPIPFDPELVNENIWRSLLYCLPFIVAVVTDQPGKPNGELVVGYACLQPLEDVTYQADLQVFVHPDHCQESIGTVLVDQILAVSDGGYTRQSNCPWRGYQFLRHIESIYCHIGVLPGTEEAHLWIYEWLSAFFDFTACSIWLDLHSLSGNDLTVLQVKRHPHQARRNPAILTASVPLTFDNIERDVQAMMEEEMAQEETTQ